MNIVQTCNVLYDAEQFNKYVDMFRDKGISSVRINTCKCSFEEYEELERFITLCVKDNPDIEFIIDVPYPHNKARIKDVKLSDDIVRKQEVYVITDDPDSFTEIDTNVILLEKYKKRDSLTNGNVIYFGDGDGAFEITDIKAEKISCVAVNDFEIISTKAISVGYVDDLKRIKDFIRQVYQNNPKVMFALSFLENGRQIDELFTAIGRDIKILAKIETMSAVQNVRDFVSKCEGIMLARGDLIYQIKNNELFEITKTIGLLARENKKRFLVATDNLLSLKDNYLPSRADLIDLSYSNSVGCTDIVLSFYNLENLQRTVEIIKSIG